jgi:NAD(P)-dependent dehydrogenase (short-subunit alcohol dehydrogenase family)
MTEGVRRTALVTGANRGIGLALVEALVEQGWHVIACCRDPARAEALLTLVAKGTVEALRLDVASLLSIADLFAVLDGRPIDLLVNNAGITGPGECFDATNASAWQPVFETNLLGVIRLMQGLKPNILASREKKAVAISSGMGSIAGAGRSDHLAYRCSKAALNMALHAAAGEWAADGAIIAMLTPGIVDTDMTAHLSLPKISAAESAAGLVAVIDRLGASDAGRFFRYNGEEVAW